MSTCLVTGASGFVGRALVERLSREHDVLGISHRQQGPGLRPVDIREPAAWRELLRETKPALVVHAAAYPEPDFCEEHPAEARRLNVDTVRVLRDTLPAAARIIFISTDYVFDGTKPPYAEDSPRSPRSEYGRLKAEAEDVLSGRPATAILRTGLQIGPGMSQNRRGFIRELVELVRDGRPATVDDVLLRFPTWTGDTAEAVAFLASHAADGVYHVSGTRGATRYGWAMETARLLGLTAAHIAPSTAVIPRKAERPLNSQLSTGKLRALGYGQFTDYADVFRKLYP